MPRTKGSIALPLEQVKDSGALPARVPLPAGLA